MFSGDVGYIASPVTGAGVSIGRIQQLFLRSIARGRSAPQEWAVDIWPWMEQQGQRLMRNGKPIPTATENISELAAMGQEFAEKRLVLLDAMGVVDHARDDASVSPGLSIAAA